MSVEPPGRRTPSATTVDYCDNHCGSVAYTGLRVSRATKGSKHAVQHEIDRRALTPRTNTKPRLEGSGVEPRLEGSGVEP
eukprot:608231-Prorocentrum_minimum.AAC.1